MLIIFICVIIDRNTLNALKVTQNFYPLHKKSRTEQTTKIGCITLNSSILHSVETNSQKYFIDSSDFIVFSLMLMFDLFILRFKPRRLVAFICTKKCFPFIKMSNKILRFFEKNNLAIHANAIWQRDLRLKTWSIVWPQQHSRIRIWDSSIQKDKVIHKEKTKSEFS